MRYTYRNAAGHERTIEAPMKTPPPELVVFRPGVNEWLPVDQSELAPGYERTTLTDNYRRVYETPEVCMKWQPARLKPGCYWPGGGVPGSSAKRSR